MRLRILGLLVLVLAVTVTAQRSLAAPATIDSEPNAVVRVCGTGTDKCVARAIGDLDGDGNDDIVFEALPTLENVALRSLWVVMGPIERQSSAEVTFQVFVNSDQTLVPLALHDVDADGMDDLVVFSSSRGSTRERQRASVLFGRSSSEWSEKYTMGDGSYGDLVVERVIALPYFADRLPAPEMTGAFADVNGDGHTDLILGADYRGADARSEVAVMLGDGDWRSAEKHAFRPDTVVDDLGACSRGFGAADDLTGDGIDDLVVFHCPGQGVPDMPRLIEGKLDWTSRVSVPGKLKVPELPIGFGGAVITDQLSDPAPNGGEPEVPRPPTAVPGRGYIPGEPPIDPLAGFDPGPILFTEDVNSDGVKDLVFEFAGKSHIWHGGPNVAARMSAVESDGIVLNASYGGLGLTRTWYLTDLDGREGNEVLFSLPMESVPEGVEPPGVPGRRDVGTLEAPKMHILAGSRAADTILDVRESPKAVLHNPAAIPWGIGDFNNDGHSDLLIGPLPQDRSSEYGIIHGPLNE